MWIGMDGKGEWRLSRQRSRMHKSRSTVSSENTRSLEPVKIMLATRCDVINQISKATDRSCILHTRETGYITRKIRWRKKRQDNRLMVFPA